MPFAADFTPAPPIAAHPLLVFLLQVSVILLLALLLGRLAIRIGLPAVVGELTAGVLLGPSLLGHVAPGLWHWLLPVQPSEQAHLLDAVAQLGVLLLVGVTGAHLDFAMVRRRRTAAIRVSLAGLLVPLSLGLLAGFYLLPDRLIAGTTTRPTFAVFLGVAMCVSAIPVIAKTLTDMNLLHRDVGQLTLAAGTVDDAVGWFLLSVVSAMAAGGVHGGHVTLSVAYLFGFVLLAGFVGRPVVRWAFRLAARTSDTGPSAVVAVVVVLAGAATTQALGLEAVFGAFVAGILIGLPGTVDGARLAGLRTIVLYVLAPVFMATAGLRMDLTLLARPTILGAAALVLAIAIVGKFAGAYLGARTSRLTRREGLALGAAMNARGVVEVVVAMVGLRLGVLTTSTYTIIVLVAIVTSVMAPPLLRKAMSGIEQSAQEQVREAIQSTWSQPARSSAASAPTHSTVEAPQTQSSAA
ncbi:MAG TPA: cation:proton antiporter [Mycobacteriales bacterium]|nr:cation:proton antiporter [Mycobacteriales bacterium]